MANIHAAITPHGYNQGDIVQLLYEIGYLIENDVNGEEATGSSDFTITVVNKKGDKVGKGDYVKVLSPNGWNQAFAVQYIYELVAYMIASITNATEADFTGRVFNLYHTVTGGSTTRNWFMYPQGVSMKDMTDVLYDIVECLIDDVTGPANTDFTLDVKDQSGNMAGLTG